MHFADNRCVFRLIAVTAMEETVLWLEYPTIFSLSWERGSTSHSGCIMRPLGVGVIWKACVQVLEENTRARSYQYVNLWGQEWTTSMYQMQMTSFLSWQTEWYHSPGHGCAFRLGHGLPTAGRWHSYHQIGCLKLLSLKFFALLSNAQNNLTFSKFILHLQLPI